MAFCVDGPGEQGQITPIYINTSFPEVRWRGNSPDGVKTRRTHEQAGRRRPGPARPGAAKSRVPRDRTPRFNRIMLYENNCRAASRARTKAEITSQNKGRRAVLSAQTFLIWLILV